MTHVISVHLNKEKFPYAKLHYIHKDSTVEFPSVRNLLRHAKTFKTEEEAKSFLREIDPFFKKRLDFCPEVMEMEDIEAVKTVSKRIQY